MTKVLNNFDKLSKDLEECCKKYNCEVRFIKPSACDHEEGDMKSNFSNIREVLGFLAQGGSVRYYEWTLCMRDDGEVIDQNSGQWGIQGLTAYEFRKVEEMEP